MNRLPAVSLLVAQALVVGLAPAHAGSADPVAEADRFLRRHVEAIGGEALAKITSRRCEGSLERHGRSVPITTYQQSPNRLLVETRFEKPGTLRQAFDGKTAWVQHPLQGGRLLSAAETAAFAAQAWLHPSLHLAEMYPLRRWVGRETHAGIDQVVLVLGKDENVLETWRFDAGSARLLEIERTQDAGPHGSVPVVIRFEDYRIVDGALVPFTVRTRLPAFETVLRLDRVEHNVPIDDALFRQPF